MALIERLMSIATTHGAKLGISDLAASPSVEESIQDRVKSGASGSLGFTFSDPHRSTNPAESFPWAFSIVVVAVPYIQEGDGPAPDRPTARFADGDRYAAVRNLVGSLEDEIELAGFRAESVYDDDRLVDRELAVRSGVAWWGKSTMALAPGLGPWFLIGSVVSDAPLEPTGPMRRSCGSCVACIPACPTGAIIAPGVLDARRCLAAIFQSRGIIDRELRPAAGQRVYGCDDCLTACPPGFRALEVATHQSDIAALDLLFKSDSELDDLFAHWYVPGRTMRFLRRNALVAVGNRQDEEAVPVLAGYVGHPDALLRLHAAWALGRVGGQQAQDCLEAARVTESDVTVLEEIDAVLG